MRLWRTRPCYGCDRRTDSDENLCAVGQVGNLRTDWQSVHPGEARTSSRRPACFRECRRPDTFQTCNRRLQFHNNIPAAPIESNTNVDGAGVAGINGVTGFEGVDAALIPKELVAVTLQVKEPEPSPVTVSGLDAPVAGVPPVQLAVKEVIGDPPEAGAVNATTTDPGPGVTLTMTGGPGCVE
jgi:hypothetical protein